MRPPPRLRIRHRAGAAGAPGKPVPRARTKEGEKGARRWQTAARPC